MKRKYSISLGIGAVGSAAYLGLIGWYVLNLLQASITADDLLSVPVVTMSMGVQGVLSRLGGCLTGSAMTFASAGKTSAPGQRCWRPAMNCSGILEVL